MKNKRILIVLALIVLNGLFVLPWYRDLDALQIRNQQLELEKKLDVQRVKEAQELTESRTTQKESFLQQIPVEIEQYQILRDTENRLREVGYTFSQVSFTTLQNQEARAEEIQISLVLEGPKDLLPQVLGALETNPRYFSVHTINVQDKTDTGVTVQLTFSAYAQL